MAAGRHRREPQDVLRLRADAGGAARRRRRRRTRPWTGASSCSSSGPTCTPRAARSRRCRRPVGAQDLSREDSGAFTGEVTGRTSPRSASRRRGRPRRTPPALRRDRQVVAAKTAAACATASPRCCASARAAARGGCRRHCTADLDAALDGAARPAARVIVAYEPVWAIGAPEPAPAEHISAVTPGWPRPASPARPGRQPVIYGGTAGPGLLTELGHAVDGLFLGRFAHDPHALARCSTSAAPDSCCGEAGDELATGTQRDRPRHLRLLLAALRPGRRAADPHRRASTRPAPSTSTCSRSATTPRSGP